MSRSKGWPSHWAALGNLQDELAELSKQLDSTAYVFINKMPVAQILMAIKYLH